MARNIVVELLYRGCIHSYRGYTMTDILVKVDILTRIYAIFCTVERFYHDRHMLFFDDVVFFVVFF